MGTNKSDTTLWTDSDYTSSKHTINVLSDALLFYHDFHVIISQGPLIFAGRIIELQFRMSRPLTDFMATLHKNGIEEKKLSKYVTHNVLDDIVTFSIK